MVSLMEGERGEVDGVPTLYFADGAVQGPLRACLMFGVGRADETILNAGVTHVVEHLTLRSTALTPYRWNGAVHLVSTRFYVSGEPEQVCEFLSGVAQRLCEIPTDRLEDELKILQVEAEKRSPSQFALDLGVRLGPNGAGLIDWPEYGFHRLEADDVQQWATDWFTRQNAVLWLSGPPPAGLDLKPLPTVSPVDHREAQSLTSDHTFVGVSTHATSLSVLLGQQWGVIPAMMMARQEAFETLRLQEAVCYDISYTHERIGQGSSIDFLLADGAPNAQQQVFDGLVAIVESMATNGPKPDQLESYKQMARQSRNQPGGWLSYLDSVSERMLLGLEEVSFAEVNARTEAMTPESVADDLRSVMPTLLATGSSDIDVPQGWTGHASWSRDTIAGAVYKPIADREQGKLVLGDEGISWVCNPEKRRTIRWDDAIACLTYDNGRRTLLDASGRWVTVVPWDWEAGTNLTELVDTHVGLDRRVNVGEDELHYLRDPGDPSSVADVRWLASITRAVYRQQRVNIVVDTDGLMLLFDYDDPGKASDTAYHAQRLNELRSLDRESLLAKSARSRWLPATEIEEIRLSRRPLARLNTLKSTLTIRTTSSEVLRVHLVSDNQVKQAKDTIPHMLGDRFHT
jgi:hypothetical protein